MYTIIIIIIIHSALENEQPKTTLPVMFQLDLTSLLSMGRTAQVEDRPREKSGALPLGQTGSRKFLIISDRFLHSAVFSCRATTRRQCSFDVQNMVRRCLM